MSWVWTLLLLCGFEGLGVDLAQGVSGRFAKGAVGIVHSLQQERHSRAGVSVEKLEGADRPKQNLSVSCVEIGTQRRNYVCGAFRRERHSLLQQSEDAKCGHRRTSHSHIGIAYVCEQSGFCKKRVCFQLPELRSHKLPVGVRMHQGVGKDINQGRQCVLTDATQSHGGEMLDFPVRVIQESGQIRNCRSSFLTKSPKPFNGLRCEQLLLVFRMGWEAAEIGVEPLAERRGLVLDPFQQKWKHIRAHLSDRERRVRCVRTRQSKPFAQGPALVAGLLVSGGNDDKARHHNAGDKKRKHEGLAFRHVARMPSRVVSVNPNSYELST